MVEALQFRVAGKYDVLCTALILVSDMLPAMGCSPLNHGKVVAGLHYMG